MLKEQNQNLTKQRELFLSRFMSGKLEVDIEKEVIKMSYSAEQKTIRDLFNSQLYRIPRNQRKYVWNKDNWEDLYLDVEYATIHDLSHFIGSIVFLRNKNKVAGLPSFTVIDGQQRIFTLTIFLASIMFLMKKYQLKNDYFGTEKYLFAKDDKNEIHNIFHSSYHIGLEKILSGLFDLEFSSSNQISSFININITDKKRDKPIIEAFTYFCNKIDNFIELHNNDVSCITLLRDGIINIEYVRIEATTEEDSYTIFEILNARGQNLADHELLKNYVMRYIQPKEKVDSVRQEWESMEKELGKGINKYLLHYLIHKYKIDDVDRKDSYKAIKKYVKSNEIEKFYKDFILKAQYYSKIYNPILKDSDDNEVCSKLEYDIFQFFKSKKQEQFRPVILSLMHQKDLGKLTEDDYNKALIFIKKFFICYTLIGKEKSNTITSLVAGYANKLEIQFSSDLMNSFYQSFKDRIPNEEWFKKVFSTIGYSNYFKFYMEAKEAEKARLVLDVYEEYLGNQNINDFTVEHIFPDSQREENSNIGNLLPLEKELNEKCNNLPIKEKIKYYKQSEFKSVKRFISRFESDLSKYTIENRRKHLAEDFYKMISE